MTDSELRRLAHLIVLEQAQNEDWFLAFLKAKAKLQQKKRRLVKLHEAASILGISKSQLYHIKDDENGRKRFSYIKQGKAKSCPILFDESRLICEYEAYLANK